MEQLVARRAHNPKVARSSRVPATIEKGLSEDNPFLLLSCLMNQLIETSDKSLNALSVNIAHRL